MPMMNVRIVRVSVFDRFVYVSVGMGLLEKTCLFSHRGEERRLSMVRNRPANWVTTALLLLQLAIGLQWQVARAIAAPPEWQASGMDARHCPAHPSKDSRTDERRGAGASTGAPSSHNETVHKHDCCGSLDCQCHCAQGPGVHYLPLSRVVLSASFLLSFVNARPPVARTNEVFRPPIA
jgi:hypothetical protein